MLTADLAQSWYRGGRTGPRYIDTSDEGALRDASALINLFGMHEGRARGELEQALEEYVGTGTNYKFLRGLIKLLTDRCRFETATSIEPAEIRRALFLKAREHHPLSGNESLRAEVLAAAAGELGCAPELVQQGLYADLPLKQQLVEFEKLESRELLDLYNLAQAQALLYRCVEMRLLVQPQEPEGYRELFGAIKAYRLIHTVRGSAQKGYEIRLDGPVSMFHRSQKYGVQMAVFLPALLLCTGWRMQAEITLKPGSGSAIFELNSAQQRLRSHYLSVTPYENPVLEKLSEAWEQFDSPWTLERSHAVIDLGGEAFIPDFTLLHTEGHQVYLEILGFWTPEHLQERLKAFAHARVKNFILAAWDELRGSRDPLTRVPPQTIVFKKNLDPVMVEMEIDKLITQDSEHRTQESE